MRAKDLLTLFRDWLTGQFKRLGHAERSADLAMHVLTFSQGAAVLANLYRDESYVAENVVTAEIIEITPGAADDRLAFLLPA